MEMYTVNKTFEVGYLGECYVQLELAKRSVFIQKLFNNFDYDFLVSNGLKIEVKTSTPIMHKDKRKGRKNRAVWSFNNHKNSGKKMVRRDRKCDFYVFVCLSNTLRPLRFYIIPNKIITSKYSFHIMQDEEINSIFSKYKNKWNLITENNIEKEVQDE